MEPRKFRNSIENVTPYTEYLGDSVEGGEESNLASIAHLFSVAGKDVTQLAAYKEQVEKNQDVDHDVEITPELAELQRMAGVHEIRNDHEVSLQNSLAERSKAAAEKRQIEREQNIQPGTEDWFALWFGDAR